MAPRQPPAPRLNIGSLSGAVSGNGEIDIVSIGMPFADHRDAVASTKATFVTRFENAATHRDSFAKKCDKNGETASTNVNLTSSEWRSPRTLASAYR
jgi:hypothetical protein